MKNLLFVINSCHKCHEAINSLNKKGLSFKLINILNDHDYLLKYKNTLTNQSLPLFIQEGKVLTFYEILEL